MNWSCIFAWLIDLYYCFSYYWNNFTRYIILVVFSWLFLLLLKNNSSKGEWWLFKLQQITKLVFCIHHTNSINLTWQNLHVKLRYIVHVTLNKPLQMCYQHWVCKSSGSVMCRAIKKKLENSQCPCSPQKTTAFKFWNIHKYVRAYYSWEIKQEGVQL